MKLSQLSPSPSFWRRVILDWKRHLVLITPLFFLWLPITAQTTEARCGFVILLMSVYYMTEALPLAVTALMPVFAFPALGIISTEEICKVYMRGTAMMFFGGLAAAVAVEHSNLHKRIALFVILKVGQSPRLIMLSFMFTTMFLSMWISNTAATAMMVPILDAILQELYKNQYATAAKGEMPDRKTSLSQIELVDMQNGHINHFPEGKNSTTDLKESRTVSLQSLSTKDEERVDPPDEESQALSTMCFLATAYGSNLGGTGFPTGTGPNLVLWGILQRSFPDGTGLNFVTWMLFAIPGMLLCVIVTWFWLEIIFIGCWKCRKVSSSSKEKEKAIHRLVLRHYEALGSITFHEIAVLVLFFFLVCLWVFRAPEFIPGWAEVLQESFDSEYRIGNASPAIFIIFLFFIVPSRPPWKETSNKPIPACLTWDAVHQKVPWGLVLLMGGGFAMAEGASKSGLSTWIRFQLQHLRFLPGQAIVFVVCLITTFLTELISNITAASILLPVLQDLAISIEMHPLYLLLPAAICCSYAFMLPVSNPPNAIAFNASTMKTSDMIKAGFLLKILSAGIMTILINTLGVVLFDLHTFPEWAKNSITDTAIILLNNSTTTS